MTTRDEPRPPDSTDSVGDGTDWTQAAQQYYDPSEDDELATAIVYAVAAARDVSPLAVTSPPLYDVIDAAALEATFFGSDAPTDDRQGVGTVEFRYTGSLVTVRSDGWIQIFEPTEQT